MIKKFFVFFLSVITSVNVSLASSSQEDSLEDEFVVVAKSNTHALPLFPNKFSAEQMRHLFKKKPIIYEKEQIRWDSDDFGIPVQIVEKETIGTLTAGNDFYSKVMPNFVQVITGTASKYASKIHFTNCVEVKSDCLIGTYEYRSSYESLYHWAGYGSCLSFQVALKLDPSYTLINSREITSQGLLFNLRDSILGSRDFISSKNSLDPRNGLLPQLCLYYIFATDEKFARQTSINSERLVGNIKDFLLALEELRYGSLYDESSENRMLVADSLYKDFVESKGYNLGSMTLDGYADCLLSARKEVLLHLGICDEDIPTIGRHLTPSVEQGKVLLLVPQPNHQPMPAKDIHGLKNNNL